MVSSNIQCGRVNSVFNAMVKLGINRLKQIELNCKTTEQKNACLNPSIQNEGKIKIKKKDQIKCCFYFTSKSK